MPEAQVIARHTIAQGNKNRVHALLPDLMPATRSEPGNLALDAYPKLNDRANHVLFERCTSLGIFAEHRETSHFKERVFGTILPPLSNRVIEQYDVAEITRAAFGSSALNRSRRKARLRRGNHPVCSLSKGPRT